MFTLQNKITDRDNWINQHLNVKEIINDLAIIERNVMKICLKLVFLHTRNRMKMCIEFLLKMPRRVASEETRWTVPEIVYCNHESRSWSCFSQLRYPDDIMPTSRSTIIANHGGIIGLMRKWNKPCPLMTSCTWLHHKRLLEFMSFLEIECENEAREGWGGGEQPVPVVVLSSVEAMKILAQDWPSYVYHLKIRMYV